MSDTFYVCLQYNWLPRHFALNYMSSSEMLDEKAGDYIRQWHLSFGRP